MNDHSTMTSHGHDGFADLVQLLQYQARTQGGRLAYELFDPSGSQDQALTYSQLDTRARQLAVRLAALGRPGDRALMLYPSGIDFIVAFFACLYAGIVGVPLYPPPNNKHMNRVVSVARDCDARLILTTSASRKRSEQLLQALDSLAQECLVETNLVETPADASFRFESMPTALAFLQYTSGSTGTPKGVMVSHQNLLHNLKSSQQAFGVDNSSRMVSWLPVHHDLGLIYGVLLPLFGGFPATLIQPASFMQRPSLWLQAITQRRATISGGPNFAFDLCVDAVTTAEKATLDLSSLRCLLNGAEPVRASTLESFSACFAECGFDPDAWNPSYGLAEATLIVSQYRPGAPVVVDHVDPDGLERHAVAPGARAIVGCGCGLDEQILAVVDPHTGQPCAAGGVGELWVSGPSVCQGYWNNPEATAECFHAALDAYPGRTFLRTGDLGYVRDGLVFVTGRHKDVIIIRGRNFYPQDIEYTVQQCWPGFDLQRGAAFAVDGDADEPRLVVVQEISRTARNKADAQALGFLAARMIAETHELQLSELVIVRPSTIPITSSGKIQRRRTKALWQEGGLEVIGRWARPSRLQAGIPPSRPACEAKTASSAAEVRQWLLAQLSERLAVPAQAIVAWRSVAELGMTSLTATTLARDIQDRFSLDVPVSCLYDYPTLDALAAWLEGELGLRTESMARPGTGLIGDLEWIDNMTDAEAEAALSNL